MGCYPENSTPVEQPTLVERGPLRGDQGIGLSVRRCSLNREKGRFVLAGRHLDHGLKPVHLFHTGGAWGKGRRS